jgi:hypothetical protein
MSEREMPALGPIEDGLAGSDPALTSMLGIFNRLTSDEEMPAREQTRVRRQAVHSPRRARRRPHHGPALRRPRQLYLRLGWQQAVLLVWVVVSAGLIAVALVLNAGGHGACTHQAGGGCVANTDVRGNR